MLPAIIFYLFAGVLLASAVMVIAARNPVHAVLFLILCFFNAAGLFVLLGAEFIAFILVIVYVGAVAVLFLFVVMMLDINYRQMRKDYKRYLPVGGTVGLILVAELVMVCHAWIYDPKGLVVTPYAQTGDVENTRAIGRLLYTSYFYPFQVSGLILLVAMIGAIVLTLRERKDARRQRVAQQMDRKISDVIEVVKVPSGKGVS
ncbi:MAG TPA: NADH-quinone oxidoreductase subunit J [Alphaproteobacteria bacterium]|nr:NADH-quinone oxidoreductase subunit J [Alphaproteobacteria bacterium]